MANIDNILLEQITYVKIISIFISFSKDNFGGKLIFFCCAIMQFSCPVIWCQVQCGSEKLVLQHLLEDHRSSDISRGVVCKTNDCFKSFYSCHGYRMHLQRNHVVANNSIAVSSTSSTSNDLILQESEISTCEFFEETPEKQLQDFQKQFAELYMFCREKHVLPVSVIRSIMSRVVSLFVAFETTHSEGQSPVTMIEIELLWENLQKEAYYRSFCRSTGFVLPRKVEINDCSFQYIPLLLTLQQYLPHVDVLNSMAHRYYNTVTDVSSNCSWVIF